jgi:hypothetical protein
LCWTSHFTDIFLPTLNKQRKKLDSNAVDITFPITNKAEFYDLFVEFVQHPDIKSLNYGGGILESMIGIDYLTLK